MNVLESATRGVGEKRHVLYGSLYTAVLGNVWETADMDGFTSTESDSLRIPTLSSSHRGMKQTSVFKEPPLHTYCNYIQRMGSM